GGRRAALGGGPFGRGRAASGVLFCQLRRRTAAARPLSPGATGDRASAPVGDACGHARQPNSRGGFARGQSQHAAQENPRSRYPGLPQQRLTRCRCVFDGADWPQRDLARPGIVAIRQHCCIKASMPHDHRSMGGRKPGYSHPPPGPRPGRDESMNAAEAATTELVTAAAARAPGWIPRVLGLAAVALALLSALVTFVVLAGLTPIPPTHEVV